MAKVNCNSTVHEFNGFAIPQREDGFLDATAMAKACGKEVKHWWRNMDTFMLFNALADPDLLDELMRWLHPKNIKRNTEKGVKLSLAIKLNGIVEVPTLTGNIDILTATEIIEVKAIKYWKSAIGQVLCYGKYYPSHLKRIHLFGETQQSYLSLIESHCEGYEISMTWEP